MPDPQKTPERGMEWRPRRSSALRLLGLAAMATLLVACNGGEDSTANTGTGTDTGANSGAGSTTPPIPSWPYYSWMHSELPTVWALGFQGQGVFIKVIDTFQDTILTGDLGDGVQSLFHGEWVSKEAGMVAPQASIANIDYNLTTPVALDAGLNVMNLSFGLLAPANANIQFDGQTSSIIQYAQAGQAIVVKSAGNNQGAAFGAANEINEVDRLGLELVGAPSAIFVGALSRNGSVANPAPIASYSTVAGNDPAVQSHFLVVGVDGASTGLSGTSFAAPIISGYAAILGSKFTTATPTQITNQLLQTARRDTVANYSLSIHGQGEASIANALAPQSIQ